MGLFKKKNAFEVADQIEILPEYYFRTEQQEYYLGMNVAAFLTEFTFAESWKEKEKLKPKTCVTVEFKHRQTGRKLQLHLVNRSNVKCRYKEAEVRGITAQYNDYGINLDRTSLQFFYKLSPCNAYLNGCSSWVEAHTLLGKPSNAYTAQEYEEKIEVKSTTPRIEEIEQEFDDQYYVLKTKVYDTYYETNEIRIGEEEIWRRDGVVINVRYSFNRPNSIEDLVIETTR